ncbi:MAG TPA: hypothetical protein EYH12_05995 [Psychromonas hadalis]|nr:hypothetical protein [Psychromonas hadalis]
MEDRKIEFSTSYVINALLHAKQTEHHYATQESVDNLKELNKAQFEQVEKQFEQVNKQFEQINKRFELVDKQFDQVIIPSPLCGYFSAMDLT